MIALRSWLRTPRLALTLLACIAVSIGGTAAVFIFVHAIPLRHWITTMEEVLDQQTVNERFWTVLATAYAGTAFLLAVIGLYGVLSHSVASRRQKMGVRLAVGATAAALARLLIGQGLRLVLSGVVAGLGVAFFLGRLLEARLYGVTARDPIALLASVFLLIVVALLACWIPARRAARTDPMTALRAE